MPALGNRGAVSPAAIKQAAKKSAPPARLLPPWHPEATRSNVGPWKAGYGAKPAPKVFSQPLRQATKQNMETGGRLRQYAQSPAGRQYLVHQEAVGEAREKASPLERLLGGGGDVKAAEERIRAGKPAQEIGMLSPPGLPGVSGLVKAGILGKTMEQAEIHGGGFAGKFWNSAAHTLANFPAGAIATVTHPIKTAEGLANVYIDPEKSWKENPAGTVMAFTLPFAAMERGIGALARKASGGRVLSMERPDLQYSSGARQARQYAPGAVTQTLQRIPDTLRKHVEAGRASKEWAKAVAGTKEAVQQASQDPAVMHPGESLPRAAEEAAMTQSHPRYMYHVSSDLNRQSIYSKGLEANRSRGGTRTRVYLSEKPHAIKSRMDAKPQDQYVVDTKGMRLRPDPTNPGGWAISEKNIGPERITHIQTTHPAGVPGILPVSGERFAQAVAQARKASPRYADNLTPHAASDYSHAYLTADEKAGYAIIKTGKKLPDGRPEVELVNLFRHGDINKGISNALIQHAITNHGANKLDAFEGNLTRKYGAHGFETLDRQKNFEPGGPDVLYMHRPNVEDATRWQERRDILGSRLGGLVRPGQIDLLHGGTKLASNLEVMKASHFLNQHLPHDPVHATALMTFLQGEAKTSKSFWTDVADRIDTLKGAQRDLSGTELAHNKDQVERLVQMEQNRSKLSDADLEHYEKAAGAIAHHQGEKWMELVREGIGHANQLHARNIPALLTHGHLLGRGPLSFVKDTDHHPLVSKIKDAEAERSKAAKEIRTLRAELKGINPSRTAKQGRHFRLEEATDRYHHYSAVAQEYRNALSTAEHTGALAPGGKYWPGVYDAAGKKVTAADAEQLLKEHFGGREMGFLTHKTPTARAQSQNSYGPRTIYPMRTGGNFMGGAYDTSPAALRDHFERAARNLAAMRGRRSVAENLTLFGADGKPLTEANAKVVADNLNRSPGGAAISHHLGEWVPYNLGAEKTSQLLEGKPYTREMERQGLVEHKAIIEEGKGAASWGVMPKDVADRLNKWEEVEKQVQGSMLRKVTSPWRQTALYTSARWPFGTTQENAIRLAAHQVSPLVVLPYGKYTSLSFGTGSHIVRMLDDKIKDPSVPHAQKQLALFHRTQFGTGNFVGAQLHELDPALHKLAQDSKWRKITESPPNTKIWRPYRRFVGNALNRMETNAKVAAGGKLARGDISFFNKFRKMSSEQAAHDYVDRITKDPAQSIKEAQKLMDIMGNWNHLTPYTRQAQAEWAPFALWWLNSAKFVFKTLPKDHPYATGLLAAMVTATGQQNRNLKPYLEGTVPLKLPILGEINANPVHYSPFDIGSEPIAKAGSMIAPQFTEPVLTSRGIDPLTGEKFEGDKANEGSEGTAAARVGVTALESYIPGLRLASQLDREGGVPTKTSIFPWETNRKLGLGKAALQTFSPFKFSYVRKKPGTTSKIGERPQREHTSRESSSGERVSSRESSSRELSSR